MIIWILIFVVNYIKHFTHQVSIMAGVYRIGLQPQLPFNRIFVCCIFLLPSIFKLTYNITFHIHRKGINIY